MLKQKNCQHLESFAKNFATGELCEACVKSRDRWVHLRTCQTCGITLCCDSSQNQHISKHTKATSHPVVISAEPRENWAFCYIDQQIKMNAV